MRALLLLLTLALACAARAQEQRPAMDYGIPQNYEIGGITVSGTRTVDPSAVKLFAGLQVGDKVDVPGERISRAIRNLWEQKLFSDVAIEAAEVRGRTIFLHIIVQEKPCLSRYKFRGITKGNLKHVDEAHLLLGIAELRLKKMDEARKAFGKVAADSKYARLAKLWSLRAR